MLSILCLLTISSDESCASRIFGQLHERLRQKRKTSNMAFTSTSALHKKEATLSYASKAILW
jgi:hypothetical protein